MSDALFAHVTLHSVSHCRQGACHSCTFGDPGPKNSKVMSSWQGYRKPVSCGLCILIYTWSREPTVGFYGGLLKLQCWGTFFSWPSCTQGTCMWVLGTVKWCLYSSVTPRSSGVTASISPSVCASNFQYICHVSQGSRPIRTTKRQHQGRS